MALAAADGAPALETTEHEILALTGTHAAFEQLYREMADRVYGLCLRMSGERRRAVALAQDVFVRVWRQRDRLLRERCDGSGRRVQRVEREQHDAAWRLAVTVVLRAARVAARTRARVLAGADERHDGLAPTRAVGPTRRTSRLRGSELVAALGRLDWRDRAAFVLHDVEGCTAVDVALFLGVSHAACRRHLRRARRALASPPGVTSDALAPGAPGAAAAHSRAPHSAAARSSLSDVAAHSTPAPTHLDDRALDALADGHLAAPERAAALHHVAGCVPCRTRHDELLAFLAAARASRSAVTVPLELWTVVSAATVYAPLVRRHVAPPARPVVVAATILVGALAVLAGLAGLERLVF